MLLKSPVSWRFPSRFPVAFEAWALNPLLAALLVNKLPEPQQAPGVAELKRQQGDPLQFGLNPALTPTPFVGAVYTTA